jgi:hypothetical protein
MWRENPGLPRQTLLFDAQSPEIAAVFARKTLTLG